MLLMIVRVSTKRLTIVVFRKNIKKIQYGNNELSQPLTASDSLIMPLIDHDRKMIRILSNLSLLLKA